MGAVRIWHIPVVPSDAFGGRLRFHSGLRTTPGVFQERRPGADHLYALACLIANVQARSKPLLLRLGKRDLASSRQHFFWSRSIGLILRELRQPRSAGVLGTD